MHAQLSADKPTRRQRRSAVTRARLLDAGMAVFLARGYDAASLAEVTERADLGTGTLHLHFQDKRALYEAINAGLAAAAPPTRRPRTRRTR